MAEVISELGFDVELTPASRDGGKDVVLECKIRGCSPDLHRRTQTLEVGQKVGKKHVSDFVNVSSERKEMAGFIFPLMGIGAPPLKPLQK